MSPFDAKILAFMLILTRVSAFIAVAPIFSWQGMPVRIKMGIALFFSMILAMSIPTPAFEHELSAIYLILLLTTEIVYGFALALICLLIFSGVKVSAIIAENQMGLNMANVFDPMSGEQAQPLSLIIEMSFSLVFLAANGHHIFLLTINESFSAFSLGQLPEISILLESIIKAGSIMLIAGLKLAAPILAAFIFILVVLAIFARIAPDMNILFISMPVRVTLGLIMASVFIPYTHTYVQQISTYLGKLLPI